MKIIKKLMLIVLCISPIVLLADENEDSGNDASDKIVAFQQRMIAMETAYKDDMIKAQAIVDEKERIEAVGQCVIKHMLFVLWKKRFLDKDDKDYGKNRLKEINDENKQLFYESIKKALIDGKFADSILDNPAYVYWSMLQPKP